MLDRASVANSRPQSEQNLLVALQGVPKPALCAIFGEALGRRIWSLTRNPKREPIPGSVTKGGGLQPSTEVEIASGMVDYISRQMAEALQRSGRRAKAVALRLVCGDDTVRTGQTRFPTPAADVNVISAAALKLFQDLTFPGMSLTAVNLTATTVHKPPLADNSLPLGRALVAAEA